MERTRWGLVTLIFVGGLLAAAQFGKISLTLPEVAGAFDRPLTDAAFLVSLVGLMGLFLAPTAGGIAAGIGIGQAFLLGLILSGAMSLFQAAMPPYWLFSLSRGVEGLAHLGLMVCGPPLMAAVSSDDDRPLVMGLWAAFFGASLAISGQIFPPILAAGGLPLLFGLHGGALLLLAAVLWRGIPRPPRARISINPIDVHKQIYGSIRFMAPGLGFVCYTFLFVAAIAFLPDALGRPSLATILPLVTLASTLLGGALCKRFSPHHVALVGYLGTSLGACGALVGVPGAVEACFVAMGLIPGASFASIPAWNKSVQDRARATGGVAQLGNLGTVTGTPVFALIYVAGGAQGVFLLIVGAALLGVMLVLWAGGRASGAASAEMVDVP